MDAAQIALTLDAARLVVFTLGAIFGALLADV